MAAITQSAFAFGWLATWRNHGNNNVLPNADRSGPHGIGVSIVSAIFDDSVQIVHVLGWCGTSDTVPPTAHNASGMACWCRIISAEEHRPWSSGRGTGTEYCVGGALGPWVRRWTRSSAELCASNCAGNCGSCVIDGTNTFCTRSALLTGL